MPKQIKIGLDKVPAPVTKQFTQLIDIEGNLLTDAAGNPLVTEDEATLGSFATSSNALSLFLNNLGEDQSIPVEEKFSETSEVSSSLLGIPRAEEQLSLFADVSTYGLDEDNWNYYTFSNATYPGQWYRKEDPIFGRRSNPTFNEGSEEQALYLKTFPSQFTFPGSTVADKLTAPTPSMKAYMNFIAMGKYLYSIFVGVAPTFANLNFLDTDIYIIDASKAPVAYPPAFFAGGGAMSDSGNFFDVEYGPDLQTSFDKIERWTAFFQKIANGEDEYPLLPNQGAAPPEFKERSDYVSLRNFVNNDCRPGGSSSAENFAILESKKTFRYQPGRASGFTFGVRMQTDKSSNSNFIEWGCSNDTDEYMFQLRGVQLNIIRRSTIRMPDALLIRQGLDPNVQSSTKIYPKGVGNSVGMWETVIPRTEFNGDNLLGSGPSGYILSSEDVTMYKIEFSWYGAIGAKFYAYIPSGNGDARWVLIHHLIIENGLGKPVLNNPDFKFKYLIYAADTSNMKAPIFLYKYGSSYYVDGGDEGTIQLVTTTTDTKQFQNRTPIVGILPKQEIENQDGIGLTNFKKAYPSQVSVSSDLACRIDIEEVVGSPDGAHYNFSPSLHNGVHADSNVYNFQYQLNSNNTLDIVTGGADGDALQLDDQDGHIIADGVYNQFVNYDDDSEHKTFTIRRRNGSHALVDSTVLDSSKTDGSIISPLAGSTFTGKVSNYKAVAASTVPIESNEFKIHFLNPIARDPYAGGRHFAEFGVGIVPFLPEIDTINGNVLRFRNSANTLETFDKNKFPFVEFSCVGTQFDYATKTDYAEWDPGYGHRFAVDPRLPNPTGEDSGRVCSIRGQVRNESYDVDEVVEGTGIYDGQWKVVFNSTPPSSAVLDIAGGTSEVGVADIGLNLFYVTEPVFSNETQKWSLYVSGDITDSGTGTGTRAVTAVQVKTITLTDDFQLESYDDNGGKKFTHREFTTSKAVRFNSQPLYLVIAMKDGAKVNCILVEEISKNGVNTHTPVFIKDSSTLTVTNSGGSSNILSPSAFNSEKRLSSIRFDSSTLNPLRPGRVLYSFFLGANTPQKIDLSNIFGRDRKGLARGLLNNNAVFFTASNLDSTNGIGGSLGNLEMTITAKEQ
tara:strand:- start:4014 stop:7379 length:3366 start_codon:yes stop_codon:yes gene_type:complete